MHGEEIRSKDNPACIGTDAEIVRYISSDLLASEAADSLMNDTKDIKETNYSSWQA